MAPAEPLDLVRLVQARHVLAHQDGLVDHDDVEKAEFHVKGKVWPRPELTASGPVRKTWTPSCRNRDPHLSRAP